MSMTASLLRTVSTVPARSRADWGRTPSASDWVGVWLALVAVAQLAAAVPASPIEAPPMDAPAGAFG